MTTPTAVPARPQPRRAKAERRLLVTRIWLGTCAALLVLGCVLPIVTTHNLDGDVVARQNLWSFARPVFTGSVVSADLPWALCLVGTLLLALLCVVGVVRGLPGPLVVVAGVVAAAMSFYVLMVVLNGLIATRFSAHHLAWGALWLSLGSWLSLVAVLVPPIRRTWSR